MGVSDRALASSPWTVVLQGTALKYDDATLLDKLEYALRVGGPAAERHLSQSNVLSGLAGALAGAVQNVRSGESHVRAAKLLSAVADFTSGKGRAEELKTFVDGLPQSLFDTFLAMISHDKEVSSWYLAAVGKFLGQRALTAGLPDDNVRVASVKAQTVSYIHHVSQVLAEIVNECVVAHQDEHLEDVVMDGGVVRGGSSGGTAEDGARNGRVDVEGVVEGSDGGGGDESGETVAVSFLPQQSSSVLQAAASSLGYIPTVHGIGEPQQLNSGDEQLGRLLSGLAAFLSTEDNRVALCRARPAASGGGSSSAVTVLASLLDKEVGAPVQVYYQAVFCLWLLSFVGQHGDGAEVQCVAAAVEEAGVPRRLTHVLKDVSSEKVVRICLATLRNLMDMSPALRKEMVGAGLVDAMQSPSFRRLDDDDVREDLGVLADALENELASMSSFDVYKAEVLSGALEWTPAHRDETFWRENVEKLERNQQEVLRCMVRLLHESSDETVLAVACNDLAQFIKFHPRGRAIAQSLGVKARLMQLMVSGEGDVRRYALNCVQVLMIRWNRQPA